MCFNHNNHSNRKGGADLPRKGRTWCFKEIRGDYKRRIKWTRGWESRVEDGLWEGTANINHLLENRMEFYDCRRLRIQSQPIVPTAGQMIIGYLLTRKGNLSLSFPKTQFFTKFIPFRTSRKGLFSTYQSHLKGHTVCLLTLTRQLHTQMSRSLRISRPSSTCSASLISSPVSHQSLTPKYHWEVTTIYNMTRVEKGRWVEINAPHGQGYENKILLDNFNIYIMFQIPHYTQPTYS